MSTFFREMVTMQFSEAHEKLLVRLIALHSVIVGTMFLLAPDWTMKFAGWQSISPVFFAYQAGIFHVVLAVAYLLEYRQYRGVSILVTAKVIAFVFLITATIIDPIPWAVWTSGIIDGIMALVVWWVHRKVTRSEGERVGT
jgi:hypothetical protein